MPDDAPPSDSRSSRAASPPPTDRYIVVLLLIGATMAGYEAWKHLTKPAPWPLALKEGQAMLAAGRLDDANELLGHAAALALGALHRGEGGTHARLMAESLIAAARLRQAQGRMADSRAFVAPCQASTTCWAEVEADVRLNTAAQELLALHPGGRSPNPQTPAPLDKTQASDSPSSSTHGGGGSP